MRLGRVFAAAGVLMCIIGFIATANGQSCCIEPTFEHSAIKGRATGVVSNGATITEFQQTIGDAGDDSFNGDEVTEASNSSGTNGCWYAGAPFSQTSTVTGGHWWVGQNDASNLGVVNGNNQWGIDLDGDDTNLVNTIRAHAVLPCTDHIPQTMYIVVNGCLSYPYYTNTQTVTISAGQVVNCRGGVCDTITY